MKKIIDIVVERGYLDPETVGELTLAHLFEEEEEEEEEEEDNVKKWVVSDNTRGNKLHDEKTGKFTSSLDYSVNTPANGGFSFETNAKPAPRKNTGMGFSFDEPSSTPPQAYGSSTVDTQIVPNDFRAAYISAFEKTVAKFGLQSVRIVAFKPLRNGSIAQTSTYLSKGIGDRPSLYNDLAIDYDQLQRVKAMWDTDKPNMYLGRMPFNACSYAQKRNDSVNGVAVHEGAHMLMAEYTTKQSVTEWVDPADPTYGTLGWKSTVESAAGSGWVAPSKYAKTNLAEMFAESVTMKELNGTTKSASVDRFIDGVIASEATNSGSDY